MDLVLPSDSPVLVEPGNWKKPQPVKIGDQPNPQPCMFNIITNEKWVTRNTGWWYTYPSEKYESQLGRIIPYIMENNTYFQTTNQIIIA